MNEASIRTNQETQIICCINETAKTFHFTVSSSSRKFTLSPSLIFGDHYLPETKTTKLNNTERGGSSRLPNADSVCPSSNL
jgi:hypothetical protein